MAIFKHQFTVNAPLAAVADFHFAPGALQKLSPPGMGMQPRFVEPLAEHSIADFVLWLGYVLPIPWRAQHDNVSPLGFRDIHIAGPMQRWEHTHRFVALDDQHTRVEDTIEYEHRTGWGGLGTRLLFSPLGLWLLFTYRKWATRWWVR